MREHGVELSRRVPANVARLGRDLPQHRIGREIDVATPEVVALALQALQDVCERLGTLR